MSDLIAVQATLTCPGVADLVLDGSNAVAYELHPDTLNEAQQTLRKIEAASKWVEGAYPTNSVRENVTENLSVWVNGDTNDDIESRIYELTRRLTMLSWTFTLLVDTVTQTWHCQSAPYTVKRQYEYLHAPTALVTAQVPRLPSKTLAGVFGTIHT